jgi:hypothetical protein
MCVRHLAACEILGELHQQNVDVSVVHAGVGVLLAKVRQHSGRLALIITQPAGYRQGASPGQLHQQNYDVSVMNAMG